MPYLIDGNNLMAKKPDWHKNKPAAKKRLILQLVGFVAANKTNVTIVFDGVPDDEFPEGRKFKGVLVRYAKPGSDADSRIKDIVKRASYKRDLIVVTSDRALASFAKTQGAKVLSSDLFRKKLSESVKKPEISSEKTGSVPVDLEDWLEFFEKSQN